MNLIGPTDGVARSGLRVSTQAHSHTFTLLRAARASHKKQGLRNPDSTVLQTSVSVKRPTDLAQSSICRVGRDATVESGFGRLNDWKARPHSERP